MLQSYSSFRATRLCTYRFLSFRHREALASFTKSCKHQKPAGSASADDVRDSNPPSNGTLPIRYRLSSVRRFTRRSRRCSQRQLTPGPILTALAELGDSSTLPQKYAIPNHQGGRLSRRRYGDMSIRAGAEEQGNDNGDATPISTTRNQTLIQGHKISLRTILSNYVRACRLIPLPSSDTGDDSPIDPRWLRVFDEDTQAYLQAAGYRVEDVMSWTWIITSTSAFKASAALFLESNWLAECSHRPVPDFILLLLLRRRDLTPAAVRWILLHASYRLRGGYHPEQECRNIIHLAKETGLSKVAMVDIGRESSDTLPMNSRTLTIMVVRLLRHARKVLPAALPKVIALMIKNLERLSNGPGVSGSEGVRAQFIGRMTFIHNRMLSLIALPPAGNPFLWVNSQQTAQFMLLREMNSYQPPLIVTREGYRAVIKVQLLHRKTVRERQWAAFKARSWPPWKQNKLGIDEDKGVEMGVSRAQAALSKLYEAGYQPTNWEKSASILSGWDTDRSPTIQIRSNIPRPPKFHSKQLSETATTEADSLVWASRVSATRTIDEAWAAFLSFKDQNIPPGSAKEVYHAMLKKLIWEAKRPQHRKVPYEESEDLAVLPGDGLEVAPPPTDPRERIYVRTSPPTIKEFVDTLMVERVQIPRSILVLLLSSADSFATASAYLSSSDLPGAVVRQLLGEDKRSHQFLKQVPNPILAAYISFLLRSRAVGEVKKLSTRNQGLMSALELIRIIQPKYAPAWMPFFSEASSLAIVPLIKHLYGHLRSVTRHEAAWQFVLYVIQDMEHAEVPVDLKIFQELCKKYDRAFGASNTITTQLYDRERESFSELTRLKAIFSRIVGVDMSSDTQEVQSPGKNRLLFLEEISRDAEAKIPRLLKIPFSASLHAFMRTMGRVEDRKGIIKLLVFMREYNTEIWSVANEMNNGRKMFRRTIIAARAFLEASVQTSEQDQADIPTDETVEDELIQEAKCIIERIEHSGGWPSDSEVELYIQHGLGNV